MRGRIAARSATYELAMYGAWQSERFAREERLKSFAKYVRNPKTAARPESPQSPGEMLAAFQNRIQAGAPIALQLVDAPRPGRAGRRAR